MTTATREDIVRWMIEIDDPLEILRVNWHQHDPFTQNGMWNVSDTTEIAAIRLMIDQSTCKGYLLQIDETDQDVTTYVAIATYGSKCSECGAQPHDSMWWPGASTDEDGCDIGDQVDGWAVGVIHGMLENAVNGFEGNHAEGCINGDPAADLDD